MITLDIEKAYDTIWHEGLLYKLLQYIPGYLVKIIQSFLSERSFKVKVQNSNSDPQPIPAGVPQGSTLSPILFLFYINDIPENPKTKIKLFADDTAISAESMNQDKAVEYIQKHLNELSTYYKKWKIKINPEKSVAIAFNNRRKTPKSKLKYNDVTIPYDTTVKYLGILLDKRLNFNKHVSATQKKIRYVAYCIGPYIKHDTPIEEKLKYTLIKAYMRPISLYAIPVWSSTNIKNFDKLEAVENRCLRKILNKKPREISNINLRKEANWTKLTHIIYERTKAFYDYKIKILEETENIGTNNLDTIPHRKAGKMINQLLLDFDQNA